MDESMRIDTKVIHAGELRPRVLGAVAMPVFQSAQFEYAGETSYHDLKYIRLNNTPNHEVLHAKLAALENAEAALVTASGMAAISTALLTVLAPGDRLLAQRTLYGGTHDFVTQDLRSLGIETDFVDPARPDAWKAALQPRTRAFYVETISNPLLEVPDLDAVAAFAREEGLVSLIDNTFASPVNYRPAEHGYDLSLHSCTKYLNGHSDLVGGAVVGRGDLVKKVTRRLNHLGGSMDPHACFLLNRGIKTLALRMQRHNQSAQALATFLEGHAAVAKVNYPGLESSPSYERGRRFLPGFGGVLSFEVKGTLEDVDRVMRALKLPAIAPSLGGVESLITRPATTSHAGMPPAERRKAGITDTLLRVSVGIEDPEDLRADFAQALDTVARRA